MLDPCRIDGDPFAVEAVVVGHVAQRLLPAPERESMTVGVADHEVPHAVRTGGDRIDDVGSGFFEFGAQA
jgi:hypothetical protein